jgi:Escherichia/Staphylococcus phage prohead protease
MNQFSEEWLETKFHVFGDGLGLTDANLIEGYASVFDRTDQSGDRVRKGAYANSLRDTNSSGRSVKMLWQHDPAQPIGIWDDIHEDGKGLFVRGRILTEIQKGAEALVLLRAGAIDGLSIGYRTMRAEKAAAGRILHEIELWEVSLVTFPMLPEARASNSSGCEDESFARALAEAIAEARRDLARTGGQDDGKMIQGMLR